MHSTLIAFATLDLVCALSVPAAARHGSITHRRLSSSLDGPHPDDEYFWALRTADCGIEYCVDDDQEWFDDYASLRVERVTKIKVRQGDRIDRVEFTYQSGDVTMHGGDGGDREDEFVIYDDEKLVEYIMQTTAYPVYVATLQFTVQNLLTGETRQSIEYGGDGGKYGPIKERMVMHTGDGQEIKAFAGYADEDTLGVLLSYYGPDCQSYSSKVGRWDLVQSMYGGTSQSVTFTEGVTHSYSEETSSTWGTSASSSVGLGFSFKGLSASASVTDATSETLSEMHSSTFDMEQTTTSTFQFPEGAVWQWVYDLEDGCGESTVQTLSLLLTSNEQPCCPPGFFYEHDDNGAPIATGDCGTEHDCKMPEISVC